eukprot:scaffold321766_cov27-Tisochrysis_lutea.AAC.4
MGSILSRFHIAMFGQPSTDSPKFRGRRGDRQIASNVCSNGGVCKRGIGSRRTSRRGLNVVLLLHFGEPCDGGGDGRISTRGGRSVGNRCIGNTLLAYRVGRLPRSLCSRRATALAYGSARISPCGRRATRLIASAQ